MKPGTAGKSIALALLSGAVLFTAVLAETRFLADMDDMPLAPGLVEIDAERVVFDKPEGRIVRAVAEGEAGLSPQAVRAFYVKTLPSLGWTPLAGTAPVKSGSLRFERDQELLDISLAAGPPLTVRFALDPK